MCYFITIGSDIDFPSLESCAEGGLCIEKTDRPFFRENMPGAVSFVNLTDRHCSCSIYNSGPGAERIEVNDDEDSSCAGSARKIFKKIFAKSEFVYVYCHMYSESIEDEELPLKKRKAVAAGCFDEDIQSWLPEDTVVFIPKELDWKAFQR
ncbi:MAG TPA: hypothetical protein PLN69_06970 [bacterium]|nr:hypothetical protein [bacterium]